MVGISPYVNGILQLTIDSQQRGFRDPFARNVFCDTAVVRHILSKEIIIKLSYEHAFNITNI